MPPAIQAGGHHRVLVFGAEGEPCRAKARPGRAWKCCGLSAPPANSYVDAPNHSVIVVGR